MEVMYVSDQLDLWDIKHPEKVVERKAKFILLGMMSKDELNEDEKTRIGKYLIAAGYTWATVKVALW